MIHHLLAKRCKLFTLARKRMGFAQAVRFMTLKFTSKQRWGKKNVYFQPPDSKVPVAIRPGTSDNAVFQQIFIEREYRCLDFLTEPRWIIDCGANVGYASIYFLSLFPEARVVAIEPDAGNYAMLVANTAPFGDRIIPIRAGVWSRDACLRIRQDETEAYKEWAFFVEEVAPGEPYDIESVSLDSILAQVGSPRIDLLKVDIEGAEKTVFSDPDAAWVNSVDNVVIELHGTECVDVVTKSLGPRAKKSFPHGELTVFRLT